MALGHFIAFDISSNAKKQNVFDGLLITVYIELKNTKRKNSVCLFSVIIDSGLGNGARSFHQLDISSNAKKQNVFDGLLIMVYIELKNTKRKKL